jgi:hypothetical protein
VEIKVASKDGVPVGKQASQLTANLKISDLPDPRESILDVIEHRRIAIAFSDELVVMLPRFKRPCDLLIAKHLIFDEERVTQAPWNAYRSDDRNSDRNLGTQR